MKKLLAWILVPPLSVVAIAFAVANRAPVDISLDPLPFAVTAPLYVVAMACIFVGLVIGGAAAWMSGGRWRRLARARGREFRRLESEIDRRGGSDLVPAGPAAARAGSTDDT